MVRRESSLLFMLFILVGLIGIPSAVHMFTSTSMYAYSVDGRGYLERPGGDGSEPFMQDTQTKSWMEIDRLHYLGYKGDGINIAIIDSGLVPHSYFTTKLNTELVKYIRVNDDNSMSKTDDWFNSVLKDNSGHGTKVTGTALQFAPESGLVFYSTEKLKGAKWVLDWYKVHEALQDLDANYAVYGVDILSVSFGNPDLPSENYDLARDIETLLVSIASKGITIFIASGNTFNKPVSWPAQIAPDTEGIFSVGAVFDQYYVDYLNKGGLRYEGQIWHDYDKGLLGWDGTSHNYDLEVMATGIDVMTTKNDGGGVYDFGGTSAATPMAAGCVACLLDFWNDMSGFSTIPNDFIEGTIRNMAEHRYANPHDSTCSDPYYYGSGIVSPYDCTIYPISVAGHSIRTGYMLTQYDSAFYGNRYVVYLEWKEKKGGYGWVTHNDLVLYTSNTGWNPYHKQNTIEPDFLQGSQATIQWRYRIQVFDLSMTITTGWTTSIVYPDPGDPPPPPPKPPLD